MTIILTSQVTTAGDGVVSNALSSIGDALGIAGFPQPGEPSRATSDILAVQDKMNTVLDKLLGRSQEQFDPNYVESGRQVIVGGNIQGGKVPALEAANVRQVYTQAPVSSVLVKKRAFSSLQNLYNPVYMDPSEQWLFRATKRLIARKCSIMSEYERLSKIETLADLGISTGAIIGSLISSTSEEMGNSNEFTSMEELKRVIYDRQPVRTTTYFADPDLPILEELGFGNGVFEITTVTNISTALGLDGSGSLSLNLEDPYRILFVTEEDIEAALRETAMSNIVNRLDAATGRSLNTAQITDELLSNERKKNGKSTISFSVGLSAGSEVSAVIDAIGLEINTNNLDDVPDNQALNATEQALFTTIMTSLKLYQEGMNKSILTGAYDNTFREDIRLQMQYARNKMRTFYLGKSIIQPMDTINIFIDGGTRRLGEGENIDENTNIFTVEGAMNFGANVLGLKEGGVEVDERLLRNEWVRAGKFPDFETFKKIRTLTLSTENATHVFGGLVTSVEDRFDASSGTYVLNVTGSSNMHWLEVSRYNEQPSLDQTQGVVYDPLTPFDIETDKATGLPTGKLKLSVANQQLLSQLQNYQFYFNSGPDTGKRITSKEDMAQDILTIGNNLIRIYQHAPGLVYKWKEGIMTATYDMHNTNPKDGTRVSSQALRRDIGFFVSNTAFDNMDAANVLSILITGKPYNPATFVQSALNTGAFVPDTTLNSGRDYFHSFLNVQNSLVKTHGNFSPFKSINVDPFDLAQAISLQQRITDKSAELQQLRNQIAQLEDQKANLSSNDISNQYVTASIQAKLNSYQERADTIGTNLSELAKSTDQLQNNIIQVAGNDVSYDLASITSEEEYRLFGDKLTFATLRRREDVIRNRDKNYFIVSDEYDKDYDIQAFVLRLRESLPDMWKSSWQPLKQLCQNVADTLNFEFYCDTQGHIVFRPPQYNRTPASVMDQMLSLKAFGGVQLFPDFLISLFQTREQSLIRDIMVKEWEIRKEAALLGVSNVVDVENFVGTKSGASVFFITNKVNTLNKAIDANNPLEPKQRQALKNLLEQSSKNVQLRTNGGLFNSVAQRNLQQEYRGQLENYYTTDLGNEGVYKKALEQLASLTGQQLRNYPEYDKAKVGAKRNGVSSPSTDIANIINRVAQLVSERSKLMRILGKTLDQNIEIASLSTSGNTSLSKANITSASSMLKGMFNRLIEDDTSDALGHLSKDRFIIKDEHIISSTFSEHPPELTNCTVTGTIPMVGGEGDLGGFPVYTAFAADFDLWRQYGWRGDKSFHKPYFQSAEYQCAPYAVMLLSRQRRVTVIGNEFYQLGDVVYITHRQMLYYITKIQHNFNYQGNFTTTLELRYGHPIGQYIPTPLDVIGKMQTTTGAHQTSYRIRREPSRSDTLLGVVVFDDNSNDLLGGKHAIRNYQQLVNASLVAQTELDKTSPDSSYRIYCMTFFGDDTEQNERADVVKNWFLNPEKPGAARDGIGKDGLGGNASAVSTYMGTDNDLSKINIDPKLVKTRRIRQALPQGGTLHPDEERLLALGITASQEAISLDPTLKNAVEIRLRPPPVGGWSAEENNE